MKQIELNHGLIALVDDVDFERVSQHNWWAEWNGYTHYGVRKVEIGGKRTRIWLHRFILRVETGVDHKDLNGLNNQKENLRLCLATFNMANRRKKSTPSASKFKGVAVRPCGTKWRARLRFHGRLISLGDFNCEEAAADAYDEAAAGHFGEFARLNFPITKLA